MSDWPRIIVHADMDAFYAAVEQRDDPALAGRPVLIGPPGHRGVVLTASYEARPFGVTSAMSMAEARRRCPQALVVSPRFDRYVEVSRQVMEVLADFSPRVEPLSLDEAFVDMTGAEGLFGPPESMGRAIKEAVREATRLTITVGISGTRFVAKVASAYFKPDGLTLVPQSTAKAWLAPQPVDRLWGAGPKTVPRLHALGLHTIGDVAAADPARLRQGLGTLSDHFHAIAQAVDPRPVHRERRARSIGSDRTLHQDVSARGEIEAHLRRAAERIARRLRSRQHLARGVRVRLKTRRFELLTRQCQLPRPADTAEALLAAARRLLADFDHRGPFRMVGMAVFELSTASEPRQLDLFEQPARRRLETTVDELLARFGPKAVRRARDLIESGTLLRDGVNLDLLSRPDP